LFELLVHVSPDQRLRSLKPSHFDT
jgi:hypothetical protein